MPAPNPQITARNYSIVQSRLQGKTYQQIADEHGLKDRSSICHILKDEQLRDIIESGTKQMIAAVPLAIDNIYKMLQDVKSPHHYKATRDSLQMAGIIPSHTTSTVINNLFVVNNQVNLSPDVSALLGDKLPASLRSDDIIDITPDETLNDDPVEWCIPQPQFIAHSRRLTAAWIGRVYIMSFISTNDVSPYVVSGPGEGSGLWVPSFVGLMEYRATHKVL